MDPGNLSFLCVYEGVRGLSKDSKRSIVVECLMPLHLHIYSISVSLADLAQESIQKALTSLTRGPKIRSGYFHH